MSSRLALALPLALLAGALSRDTALPPSAPSLAGALRGLDRQAATFVPNHLVDIDILVKLSPPPVVVGLTASIFGSAELPIPILPEPLLAGFPLVCQFLFFEPGPPPCPTRGLSASNRLNLVIQP